MSRQLFATIAVPTVVLAALWMAEPAGALPPPRIPPPPRPPVLPALRPPGPAFMGGPAGALPHAGSFARPVFVPPGPTALVRPGAGALSPALPGRSPGGWVPPVVNHGWARPAPNLIAGRVPTINRANTVSNDHRTYPGRGSSGWHHDGPRHAWGGAYAAAAGFQARATAYDGPRYAWGGDYSGYSYSPYYGDSPYNDSYPSSGSASDSGASGSSYQPASSSPVPASEGATTTDQETAAAERYMELARRAFRMGDYAEAQRECEGALRLLPGDANLYEFGALCRFAQGNYKDAAATLYQVLAARPGWSWDTLTSFYPSAQTYTTQLRALERYARADPGDAAGHFVLAYHYRALDERDAAVGQLREVIKLQPRDQVSPGILETLEKAKDGKDGAPARRPAPGLAE